MIIKAFIEMRTKKKKLIASLMVSMIRNRKFSSFIQNSSLKEYILSILKIVNQKLKLREECVESSAYLVAFGQALVIHTVFKLWKSKNEKSITLYKF